MINRNQRMQLVYLIEKSLQSGDVRARKPEIDELRCAKNVGVSVKGGDFAASQ